MLHLLALSRVNGIGPVMARKLIQYFGNAEEVFRQPYNGLVKLPRITSHIAHMICSDQLLKETEKELIWAEKNHIQVLDESHEAYPKRLLNCYDRPLVLFLRGTADLNTGHALSIVGTRSPTDYGRNFCYELLQGLIDHEPLVASGLAYGIDAVAHRSALEYNLPTIAVLAHGLDRVYPAVHRKLTRQILDQGGALLTEFQSGTQPDRENFPKRNRIVAGLCDALIVVESAIKGGSMITARFANTYNRDVFALPGRTTDELSSGCLYLIKTHQASLLQKADDVVYLMGWKGRNSENKQTRMFFDLTEEQQKLYDFIKSREACHWEDIHFGVDMADSVLHLQMLNLEIMGLIQQLPGNLYKAGPL